MDRRYLHQGRTSSRVACAALALAAACNPPELGGETSQAAAVEGTQEPTSTPAASSFTLFESGQVRPLAVSPDKQLLFAVNTPDNRLEVFRIGPNQLVHTASIPVGLEPVAVAARTSWEVWVVNHLSDSVSVVQLDDDRTSGVVRRTLLVGDEPRDIVFAGPGQRRAFITTAHRGQNAPFDPALTTPGVGRADVWVFDALALGQSLGGTPLSIIPLFTDTPRALAATPDGTRVYAAGFHTGNRTAIVNEGSIPNGFGPGGVVGPATNHQGHPAPEVGAIVQWNGTQWVDSAGYPHDDFVKFSLPDKDVFVLDAMASPPQQLAGAAGFFQGVGTILYSMVVNPASGKLYVANTDANNLELFEGPGIFAGHSLRGHLHESRITVLSPVSGSVVPRHLNKHIDYASCCAPTPNAESARSLALPQGMAVTASGATLYVAALGSDKVGIFSTGQLEADTFVPSAADHVAVSGGGPTGLILDEARGQLYVMTRFDNAISIIDTATQTETRHVGMHNPEPPSVVAGRRFLYDASFSSSHGDSSCASCHVFGDVDSLAWNLGNPDGDVVVNYGPFASALKDLLTQELIDPIFHPMKGPMVTQSLRGMANHGPMHWRGDRTGASASTPNVPPNGGAFDERAAFQQFQAGFTDLLGRNAFIPPASMDAFTDFILQVTYPPNPIRPLDNVLTADQETGRQLFNDTNCGIPACLDDSCPTLTCASCHTVDPNGQPGDGFFGTSGFSSFDFQTQLFKVPHLRNMYQKVGMFGHPPDVGFPGVPSDFEGDQVRGFGFLNDGNMDTMFRFIHGPSFSEDTTGEGNGGFESGPAGEIQRRQVEAFLLAFPTNLAPIVGQQITLTAASTAAVLGRMQLLRQRADAGECELVAKTELGDHEVGFVYVGAGYWRSDRRLLPPIHDTLLRLLTAQLGHPVTYTCTPPGSGTRIGVDRDGDGFWDGDERDAHSDPADPSSTPS